MIGTKLISVFEEYFPQNLAYSWDNVGLQIGTKNKEINNVLISLDVTKEVVQEAIDKDVEMIIAHHPLIFSPLKSIHTDANIGTIIELLIKHNITLYIAHTNFDISNFGLNKMLGDKLQLENEEILDYTTDFEGLGRIGDLPNETPLEDFITHLKELFDIDSVKLIGSIDKTIKKVAVCGGSGSSLISAASRSNADVYVSGDITYHHALDARALGLTVLDVGHHIEVLALKPLLTFLQEKIDGVVFHLSETDTDPYKTI